MSDRLGYARPWYHAAKSASVSALSPQVPNASSYPYQNSRYTPAPQLARTPSLAARAIQANPVLAPRTPPPTPMPLGGPGRPLASPRTLPRLPGTSHSPLSPSGPPSGPGVAQWVKTATPEEDAQRREALAYFSVTPDRLRGLRDELEGMDQFAGGYQDQRRADDAMSANVARFAGTGLGGLAGTAGTGVLGAMAGAPAGALVGLGRGDVVEGAGRGLVRGGLTGLGAGAGRFVGRLAGEAMGHPELGHWAGLLGGGTAGWLGSGALLGEPKPRHEKKGADDPGAGLPVAPEAGDMAQPASGGGDPGGSDPGGGGGKGPKPPTPDQLHLRDATSAAMACMTCANFDGQSCQLMHVPVAPSNLCDAFAPGPQLAGLNTQAIEQAGGAEVPPLRMAGLGPSPLRGEGHEKSAAGILGGIGSGLGRAGRWAAQGAKDLGHRRVILGHGLDHPYTQADLHPTGVPRPPVRSLFSPLVGQERMQRFYTRYGRSMQVPNTPEMRAQHLYGGGPVPRTIVGQSQRLERLNAQFGPEGYGTGYTPQSMVDAYQQAEGYHQQAGLRNEAGDAAGHASLMDRYRESLRMAEDTERGLAQATGVLEQPTGSRFGAPRTDYRRQEGAALGTGLAGTAAGAGFLYGRSGRPPAPGIPGSVSGRAGPPPAPTPAAPTTPATGGAGLPGPGAAAGGETAGTPPPTGEAAGPGWGEWLGGQMGAVGEHLKNNWQPYALGAGGVLGAAALIQALSARRRKQRRQELLAQLAEQEGYGKEGAARPGNLDLADGHGPAPGRGRDRAGRRAGGRGPGPETTAVGGCGPGSPVRPGDRRAGSQRSPAGWAGGRCRGR
jgi:hypothetical protein